MPDYKPDAAQVEDEPESKYHRPIPIPKTDLTPPKPEDFGTTEEEVQQLKNGRLARWFAPWFGFYTAGVITDRNLDGNFFVAFAIITGLVWTGLHHLNNWYWPRAVNYLDAVKAYEARLEEKESGQQQDAQEQEQRRRRTIPEKVKRAVWQRDQGRCVGWVTDPAGNEVQRGSQSDLEYDHIIPVSKGGSNTERNIQLLCEHCNRTKSASI